MSNRSKTYYIKTYGCQANVADSERIKGYYQKKGYRPAQNLKEADVVVINTCSVRQAAENRVYGLINNIVTRNTQHATRRKIVLAGCMLRYGVTDLKKKIPQIDEFLRIEEITASEPIRKEQKSAWVPIMEGCNQFCSYCVVPYARGREKSRPFEEIVCEVEKLVDQGYKEITLLGQNVNAYNRFARTPHFRAGGEGKARFQASLDEIGKDKAVESLRKKTLDFQSREAYKPSFAGLLRRLNEIPGLEKIKFLTNNPWDLTDEIIQSIKLPKIEKYLHLPVQSGDDEILKKMNRPYTAKEYLRLINKMRQEIPEIKIGTDIIVGFPGETEKQFQHTVDLCKKIIFEKAYLAKYSPRPGTAAYKFPDNVSPQEKKRRWKILEELIN